MLARQLGVRTEAPIVPAEGLGGFKLRAHVSELEDILDSIYVKNLRNPRWYELVSLYEARYDLGPVAVAVDVRNGKVFKVIASEGYEGKLFGKIHVGMSVREAMALEPRMYYDEAEEGLYLKGCPGVVLEVPEDDPWPREVRSYPISAISVYAPEVWAPEATTAT